MTYNAELTIEFDVSKLTAEEIEELEKCLNGRLEAVRNNRGFTDKECMDWIAEMKAPRYAVVAWNGFNNDSEWEMQELLRELGGKFKNLSVIGRADVTISNPVNEYDPSMIAMRLADGELEWEVEREIDEDEDSEFADDIRESNKRNKAFFEFVRNFKPKAEN